MQYEKCTSSFEKLKRVLKTLEGEWVKYARNFQNLRRVLNFFGELGEPLPGLPLDVIY